jgi:hypothetical protein
MSELKSNNLGHGGNFETSVDATLVKINLSISSGVVPEDMKVARVCPIFKKNSRLDVVNYRPISILIIISKILEKTVYLQLEKYTY